MARAHICHSSHCNSSPGGEDGLAGNPSGAFTKDSNTLTLFLPVFRAQTLTFAQAPIHLQRGAFPTVHESLFRVLESEPGPASRSDLSRALRAIVEGLVLQSLL